jgi:acyl dehydratase
VNQVKPQKPLLYLDDLAVGQRFESEKRTVSLSEMLDFAKRFDPQPFHLDEMAAKESLFKNLVASGWYMAAITMSLLVTSGLPFAGGIIGSGGDIRWPLPVRPDDVLRVVSEIVEVRPSSSKPDRGYVVVKSETLNQQDQVVQILTARLVAERRRVFGD